MSTGGGMERVTGLPYKLTHDKLMIGSDDRQALVRVSQAEGVHAVICYVRDGFEEGKWWIEDKSQSGVLLNCERLVGKARLSNGDSIVVAGANILFSNGWLREDHRLTKGVRVDVRELCDARKGYTILRSVSFTANEGEFVGILGPSGCGKSSVIQRVAGLARYASGSIAVNGHPVGYPIADDNKLLRGLMTHLPQHVESSLRQLIAYLPQNVDDSLHNSLTPLEEMACARRIYLAPGDDDDELDVAILGELELSDEASRPIGKLSGGQKRRVAIALALLRQPQLLLLDEPTAGLDPATETEVMDSLHRLARQGRTVICATHVMANVSLFDKVLVMSGGEQDHGRPVYFGSPDGLLAHFGVDSYPALYARLKDGSCGTMSRSDGSLNCEVWDLPEPPTRASFGQSVIGYLLRFLDEFKSTFARINSWFERLIPVSFRTLIVQPVLLAVGIKCACAKMFYHGAVSTGGGVSTALFCAALAMFWLGLVGNVQGLVRERIPRRCLERLGGISLVRYMVAKLIAIVCPCLVQTLVFAILLFRLPEFGSASNEPSLLVASFGVGGVFFGVCLIGGLIGSMVSAWSRTATRAVGIVPLIAALALFFSQPVIGFDMADRTKYGLAERIAEWMPCYRSQVYMCVLERGPNVNVLNEQQIKDGPHPKEKAAPWWFLGVFGLYAVVTLLLSFIGQYVNECRWEGR